MIKHIETKIENWHLKKQIKLKNKEIKGLEKELRESREKISNLKLDVVNLHAMMEEKE